MDGAAPIHAAGVRVLTRLFSVRTKGHVRQPGAVVLRPVAAHADVVIQVQEDVAPGPELNPLSDLPLETLWIRV